MVQQIYIKVRLGFLGKVKRDKVFLYVQELKIAPFKYKQNMLTA